MKKAVIIITVVILGAILLASCSNKDTYQRNDRFVCIENTVISDYSVWVDTETGVEYLKGYHGGYTVIVNEDGTPKIHDTDTVYLD